MSVARLLALAAVLLLIIGGSPWMWIPVRERPPWISLTPLESPWYFAGSTMLLFAATMIVFAEGRIALALAFLGGTAASGGLWLYRYRGGR